MKCSGTLPLTFFSSQELRDWWNVLDGAILPFFHPRNYVIDEIAVKKLTELFFIPGITWLMKCKNQRVSRFFSSQELRDWWNPRWLCRFSFFHPRNYVIDEIADIVAYLFFSSQELRDWWNGIQWMLHSFFHPRNYVIDEMKSHSSIVLFFIPGITWLMKYYHETVGNFFSSQELRDWWNVKLF